MSLPKILLVDDEANILRALRRALRKLHADIESTTSPQEALRMVEKTEYAVVVSDQRMPEISGTDLLEQVRALSPDSVRMILTGYADVQATVDAINKGAVYRYLNKPWNEDDLRATLRQAVNQFLLVHENRRLKALSEKQTAELKDLNENLKQMVMERTWEVLRLNQMLEEGFMSAVEAMAHLAELHSAEMGDHSKRVAVLAKAVAKRLGTKGKKLTEVEIAALLHDIGKINIDPSVLKKHPSVRSEDELNVLQSHPEEGEAIVRMIPGHEEAALCVRHHHERADGKGYPDGLAGADIPLGARVIAVADAFDKALHAQTDLAVMTPRQALHIVQSRVRTEFDPYVVEALARVVQAADRQSDPSPEIEIRVRDLQPGMVLANDLQSVQGDLIIRKNMPIVKEQVELLHHHIADHPLPERIAIYRKWPLQTIANC